MADKYGDLASALDKLFGAVPGEVTLTAYERRALERHIQELEGKVKPVTLVGFAGHLDELESDIRYVRSLVEEGVTDG